MKVLFLARHFGYLRNYESAVLDLARAGHDVHLAADRDETAGAREMVERWAQQEPRITTGWTPDRESDDWFWLATRLRLAEDFLRYQDPRYDSAPHLRLRAEERMPGIVLAALTALGGKIAPVRRALQGILSLAERAVPRAGSLDEFIRSQRPDVVLVTPLVELGSPQVDHLRAAQAAGARTGLCVGSWDHLSSKSIIRTVPDRVFVWNDTQRREAIELHGVPADRIVVTGAQCFDYWFDTPRPSSRTEFLQRLGLDPDARLIVWLCSSLFRRSPAESGLVEKWLRLLRASADPLLRTANVLIRPHPQRLDEWRAVDVFEFGRVAVRGGYPIDQESRGAYVEAVGHSDAVVGLNTTALIEAGIAGKHVLSIVQDKYAHNQEGTLHWRYLSEISGGILKVARTFDEHLMQLGEALRGPLPEHSQFVEAFVRPHGLSQPATPRLVQAVEALGESARVTTAASSGLALLLRPLLYPFIWLRRARTEWIFFRKRAKRDLKRGWQGTRRGLRQGLKALVLKRMRSEQPQAVMSKTQRQRARGEKLFEGVEEVEETKEALTRAGRSGQPILVGPWLSETGFELLYWIPFLHWAKAYANIRDDRLIVISRGGCQSWYRHISTNYHDVFDFFTPEEFVQRNESRIREQRGQQKHIEVAGLDEEILAHVRRAAGVPQAEMIHPSLMYRLFRIFWRLQASVGLVQGYTAHRKMTPPPLRELASHLPSEYVAVKFYTNNSFPDTAQNRAFVASYLAELTRAHEVVLLNTGVRFDEHDDFTPLVRERVHLVDRLMTPRNNLDVQTRIIGGARAFVGTYGGFSYLAPLLGVNTLAFFSDPSGFRVDHLEIAKRVFTELGAASFLPLHIRDLEVLRMAVPDGGAPNLAASSRLA